MITHVAIKYQDGIIWSLPKPNRHGDVVKYILQNRSREYVSSEHDMGFLNDLGQFLDRRTAWFEAYKCKQILPPYNPINPNERRGEPSDKPGLLFSEDIW